jgi:ABC-type nitrate/sulfonate/bicarbonate transport system substrate-binding protein
LEKKGFPTLFDIGSAIPGFPFVVIVTSKQKIENDPDEIVGVLRAIQRGLEFLKRNREKVADAVIKKNKFGDPATVRQVINQFAEVYSVSLQKSDVEALIGATRIEAEAKKLGGTEKFYTSQFLTKASGQK